LPLTAGIDIGFLRRDPTEIIEPWQTNMLDNEIQPVEIGGDVIDIMDIESVGAQGVYGWSLVHVDVFDSCCLGQLQILVGPRIVEAPAARAVAPLGGIEL
jgi:hypothetical protein